MPYKRYVGRRKRTFRKSSMGKRRLYRKLRVARRFTKADGVNAHKFTVTVDVAYSAAAQFAVLGWHGNQNIVNTLQIFDTPEWTATSNLYEMYKTKGFKVMFEPVDCSNQPGNRQIKSVHIGSWPNLATADAGGAILSIAQLQQRLDYKCYNGNQRLVKRYYKVSKAIRGAIQSPGQTANGYCPTVTANIATRNCDMGCSVIAIESSGGWQANDYMGRLTCTWFANFKDRKGL